MSSRASDLWSVMKDVTCGFIAFSIVMGVCVLAAITIGQAFDKWGALGGVPCIASFFWVIFVSIAYSVKRDESKIARENHDGIR